MARLTIHFYSQTLFLILIIEGKHLPDREQFCEPHPQGWDFYKFHWTRMHRYRCWFCLENYTYVDRINLCADMYGRSTDSEVISFDVPKAVNDEETKCERRATVWYEIIESSLEHLLFKEEEDKPKTSLGVDVFKCPITRMNVTLKAKKDAGERAPSKKKKIKKSKTKSDELSKQVPWTHDFYLSVGRNLITLAVLTPDPVKGENMCIRDVHFYPECEPLIDACFIEDAEW